MLQTAHFSNRIKKARNKYRFSARRSYLQSYWSKHRQHFKHKNKPLHCLSMTQYSSKSVASWPNVFSIPDSNIVINSNKNTVNIDVSIRSLYIPVCPTLKKTYIITNKLTTEQFIVLILLPDILLHNDWDKRTISNQMTRTLITAWRSGFSAEKSHTTTAVKWARNGYAHNSRTDCTDSPDCLPILLSISVFTWYFFFFTIFSVFGSVR